MTTEYERLQQSRERSVHWKRWGPYLSERAWGTVREDYSPNGTAWDYLPHDHARSKAFRWGEDGLGGISDRHQQMCFALALWNGRDPILKERLFGLTGEEGNHGEDVKEYYYYLDSTPTHSYMKYLYKYPQAAYPYAQLVEENRRRDRTRPEYELIDTGIFDDDRYFDVFVEYAKAGPEDILIRVTVINRGNEQAKLDLLPTLWFRNTWSWIPNPSRPILSRYRPAFAFPTHTVIEARPGNDVDNSHIATGSYLGNRWLYCETPVNLLFTENETNQQRLYGVLNNNPYVKDGINEYIVHGNHAAVNPEQVGTKAAAHYQLTLAAGESRTIRMRFSNQTPEDILPFDSSFDTIFAQNIKEADDFYATIIPQNLSSEDAKQVQRQAFAGMLWSKEFYFYDVKVWLNGDPTEPAPPPERLNGRNHEWTHLYNADVISMPDKWEYPWYAAWDLAFHCVAFAFIDPDFAKEQLILLLREWYLHPNGQIPAYEWAFGDVNPPVHAWAAYHVYKIEQQATGKGDRVFLEKIFQKLLLNFTWWVNRKDFEGQNVFQGGFLGLDNIGVFDRNVPLPDGSYIEQSDGTSWMGMYCLNMLTIALELARENRAYSDIASKFFEHFVLIAHAMNEGSNGIELWDEQDGFYYDVLHHEDKTHLPLKVRSMVGLIPLFAISILESDLVDQLPSFQHRMQWFINNWSDINDHLERKEDAQHNEKLLLAIVNADKLPRVLKVMLDEAEFLSRYGLRALSRYHLEHPYMIEVNGVNHMIDYEPAESNSELFGGNSNWRGPIWFPLNYLIIESLQRFYHFYGDEFKIEFPTGSGKLLTLEEVATELAHRLTTIFLRDESGRRAVHGDVEKFQHDPYWRDLVLFYEYFHGDNGSGLGASHQTGWTGLVANLLLLSSKGQTHTLMHETTQMPG